MRRKKPYVQFSKRVVVSVTTAVTVICALAIWLCWTVEDAAQIVAVTRGYLEYSTIVFVAYSGNSAVEKWLIHRKEPEDETESKDDGVDSNG